jgi:hypothetical protein
MDFCGFYVDYFIVRYYNSINKIIISHTFERKNDE